METDEFKTKFKDICTKNPDISVAVAAIQTLTLVIEKRSAGTVTELHVQLNDVIEAMCQTDTSVASVRSGCELFMRYITLAKLDSVDKDPLGFLNVLCERANGFINKVGSCRPKIAQSALPIVADGATILIHSYSRVVLEALCVAAKQGRQFRCYVTTCHVDNSGQKMFGKLQESRIDCTLIADTAIGYIMPQVDLVIVGAEAVVESGGVINRLGTCTLAMVAKTCKKPVYVLAESFKFVRCFPLDQRYVPEEFKYVASTRKRCQGDLSAEHPLVDYTAPQYLTLLITDLGVLTPSAVSDELIRLYL